MKAIVLAGGRGKRLGSLTGVNPKPMIQIAGKPLLEHLLIYASEAGINDYIVSVGYLGSKIMDYFGNGSRLSIDIQYFESGGKGPEDSIFECRDYLTEETFYCFCGDSILLPQQIEKISRLHAERNADATFTLEEGDSATIKRVKVRNDRIVASSTDTRDPILTYNMVMQTAFLDKLYSLVKDREDNAFAFAMDSFAEDYKLYAADIGPFININKPDDIPKAERVFKDLGHVRFIG